MTAAGAIASAGATMTSGAASEFFKGIAQAGLDDATQDVSKLFGVWIGSGTPVEKASQFNEFRKKHPVWYDLAKRSNRVAFMSIVKVIPGVKSLLGPTGEAQIRDFVRELFKGVEEGVEGAHSESSHGGTSHDGPDLWMIETGGGWMIHLKPCPDFEIALQEVIKTPKKPEPQQDEGDKNDRNKKKPQPQSDTRPPRHAHLSAADADLASGRKNTEFCELCKLKAKAAIRNALEHEDHEKTGKHSVEPVKTNEQKWLDVTRKYMEMLTPSKRERTQKMLNAHLRNPSFKDFIEMEFKRHNGVIELEHVRSFFEIGG